MNSHVIRITAKIVKEAKTIITVRLLELQGGDN